MVGMDLFCGSVGAVLSDPVLDIHFLVNCKVREIPWIKIQVTFEGHFHVCRHFTVKLIPAIYLENINHYRLSTW